MSPAAWSNASTRWRRQSRPSRRWGGRNRGGAAASRALCWASYSERSRCSRWRCLRACRTCNAVRYSGACAARTRISRFSAAQCAPELTLQLAGNDDEQSNQPRPADLLDPQFVVEAAYGLFASPRISVALDRIDTVGRRRMSTAGKRGSGRHADGGDPAVWPVEPFGGMDVVMTVQDQVNPMLPDEGKQPVRIREPLRPRVRMEGMMYEQDAERLVGGERDQDILYPLELGAAERACRHEGRGRDRR